MAAEKLYFNILTFDFPKEPQTFYFSREEQGICSRIHRTLFPKHIETIFPGITAGGAEFIYTTYTYQKEGFTPLQIDFKTDTPDLIKKFYNRQINYFFKKVKNQIVRKGFINENQIWVPSAKHSTREFAVYEKFSLKVQLCSVSNYPELVLSYDGKSKVMKQSVAALVKQVSPTSFGKLIKEKQIWTHDDLAKLEEPGYEKAYPVLNWRLRNALGIEPEPIIKGNRYKSYYKLIQTFYDYFLNKEEFKEIIPLHETGFLKVDQSLIAEINDESNDLAFKDNKKGRTPKTDFRTLKPFEKSPHENIHLFFIYHKDDEATKDKLKNYFENGHSFYKGLYGYAGILYHTDKDLSIQFSNKANPLPEIQEFFDTHQFNTPQIKYLAIYLTPYTKAETRLQHDRIYVRVKEMLLNRNIACQSVEPETVEETNFVFSLTNMSVAILAKLDGIPWRLHTPVKNELIVGIGAFRHYADNVQYLSSAFSFDNTGHFNCFDYFMKHEIDVLAGCIAAKVKEFAALSGSPERLIIHFYKRMNEEEVQHIGRALKELQLPHPIPIFIITVNKTEAKDIVAFDTAWSELMPYSGTYIDIGNKKFLLFNNSRYRTGFSKQDGFPFPVKLSIDCTDEQQLKNEKVIDELINQVYQFSRMYWKSVIQQNLPVTVKYPEMVAEIAPYFENTEIPLFGKNSPWFL